MEYTARRSTLAPQNDPYSNIRSNLPVPTTVKKPAHGHGRMSLAGPAIRAPYPMPPPSNPRQSLMRSQNVNPLLQSASKPQGYGRTPMHNSTRRGSIWHGGNQAAAPPSSQPTAKDTRPLRDRSFQSKMRQEIGSYLMNTGFDVTPHMLQNISAKDFRAIFQHLIACLDPIWPFDLDIRFEDHFMQALRAMKYPYVNQVDQRWLSTPGAMNSWPTLLGMLHWLTELGKAHRHYPESRHPTLQDPDLIPDEFDDDNNNHLALALQYNETAYEVFLQGQDVFHEQEKLLEERYARKDARVLVDLEQMRERLREIQFEWEQLKRSAPPYEELKKDNDSLKRDKFKFEEILRRWEERKQKWLREVQDIRTEVTYKLTTLDKLRAENHQLADVVKEQNLSEEEVLRMKTEHENLSRELESLKHKIDETSKIVVRLEVSLTRKVDDAQEALDQYTALLTTLELFPPLPAPLEDIDLTIQLNSAASNPQGLLTGADIRKVVKPALNRIAEMKMTARADVESERIRVEDELDQLTLNCETIEGEVLEVKNKTNALNDQADELREAAQQEALVSSAEASRLERDLAAARTAAMANGVGVKSRLQALQIAYREQVEKTNRLKEETIRAVIKSSSDILAFKDEVSKQLQYLRDFAEAN
ncbi:HEC/Ndc80p family-domain-containing protein [Daedaleopsis nitida]|nr:HEC/Ndc80p family-domain-containing protein [Daedaleopsis nitida]